MTVAVAVLAVNPKIWLLLGVVFVLGLARRLWRGWRARRRAARLAAAGVTPQVSPAAMAAVRIFDAARTALGKQDP